MQTPEKPAEPDARHARRVSRRPHIVRVRPEDPDLTTALERNLASGDLSQAEAQALRRRPTQWTSEGTARKLAVFVTHGMGQQLPFESAATVAEGLIEHNPQFAGQLVPLTACNTSGESGRRQHLAFHARDARGEAVEIHVHEGYWAPLTEGRVHTRDVLRFLYSGAINSLRAWRFTRYMFGRTVDCRMSLSGHLRLLTTTLILSFFVLLNFVVACTLVGLFLRDGLGLQAVSWPGDALVDVMNCIMAVYLAITAAFMASIALPVAVKKRLRRTGWWQRPRVRGLWRQTTHLAQAGAWLWYGSTLGCLGLVLAAIVAAQRDPQTFQSWAVAVGPWPVRVTAPFWLLLFVAFGVMRRKLVQFMGDVAAYVSPHVLDRFMNIRSDIKKWVFDAARHVYERRRPDGSFEYDGVVLVGHSLGSVVMYDTLNALLNDDLGRGRSLRVAERTLQLVTFGSPLDKTAFIFSRHRQPFAETRGLMAAAVQPLIGGYEHWRRVPWVNVYAPRDLVCDALCFYDDPQAAGYEEGHVRNVVDCDAAVPLAAHVEYWQNSCIYEHIWQGLGARVPATRVAAAGRRAGESTARDVTGPRAQARTREHH